MEKPPVLLVDDNEATCTLIRALLAPEFNVHVAYDGNAAIEKLRSRRYAAVLLDLLMPVTSGYGVLDFLRDERPEVLARVIVVTAALTPTDTRLLRAYPHAGVISKPFEVDLLLDAVRRTAAGFPASDAGDDDHPGPRGPLISSSMLFLLASVLDKRWM